MKTFTQFLLAATVVFFSTQFLSAQDYTTIADGDFTSPSIWSTDGGSTGCNCVPGTEVATLTILNTATTIDINHNVTLPKDLVLLANFLYVNVNFGATLSGDNRLLDARIGQLNVYGNLSVGSMIIYNGAQVNSTGSMTISPGDLDVAFQGRLNVGGTLNVPNGDFNNIGMVDILANAQVTIGGEIVNDAEIDIEPGACINVTGNVTNNYQINLINGPGTAYIQSGANINNNDTWATEVDWCAAGSGIGLSHSSNCSNCGTLPVELIGFEAEVDNGQVILSWETASETANSFFTIERSNDGTDFETLIQVDSESPVQGKIYQAFDVEPYSGISYYRLSQTDMDGTTRKLETVMINNADDQTRFNAFPNPFTETVRITAYGMEGAPVTVKMTDLSGRVIRTEKIDQTADFEVYSLHPGVLDPGLYVVTVSGNQETKSFKLLHR